MNAGFEDWYPVVVLGGGHGGCEAALASARMGVPTLLLNMNLENTALMACNPSIGGPAKGHLTREVDAMGGFQALAADLSALQIRWLNTSKGPAVRTLRVQCDMWDFHRAYRERVESQENLHVLQAEGVDIWVEDGAVRGVKTSLGSVIGCRSLVLALGTYTGAAVYVGLNRFEAGPMGNLGSYGIVQSLRGLGLRIGRLKTGTPPRIHKDTVDWNSIPMQEGDGSPLAMSIFSRPRVLEGFRCGCTRTSLETHRIIEASLDRSPLYTGMIQGKGPRYCPSIEDKVVRFPQRESHPVFLEPVGRASNEIYVQNMSTSLPYDVQVRMIRTLPGCERARILKPGYAIEYFFVDPTQLEPWLEVKSVKGLFLAGQINGTSGYEEAAAQGLLAGANAGLFAMDSRERLVLGRHEAYAGVLVDDLVTKGTAEPYRMLTSRCEHRLRLRHDNPDVRLSERARSLGLLGDLEWRVVLSRMAERDRIREALKGTTVHPTDRVRSFLASIGSSPIEEPVKAVELAKRPEVQWEHLVEITGITGDQEAGYHVVVEEKYRGYVEREDRHVERLKGMEGLLIPEHLDYDRVDGLLSESREKLKAVRPRTLGQAGRISGVTPADLQVLWMHILQGGRGR
ncbi:MAG: tRNA uridine-5-carboxymethylaminomethyl(34) synthesis enzyme MnmG [Thermanaerothrix sp.]|nr:tRNA uridine-5-carboxymethylaminomethyl(34) synthesis enzyme MnmG [Thermanaerothrix sp.]